MVTRWPGTEGYGDNLPNNVTAFTLHGVWPTRDDGSWPQYCNDSQPFEASLIESLVGAMWESWYDFTGNGFDFWSHEWDKHGTCAEIDAPMDSEFNFFSVALKLVAKYNPKLALDQANITASNTYWYSPADITTAINNYFGVTPTISCQNSGSLGVSLDVVQLCISKSFQLIACPSSVQDSSCGSQIFIPEIQYDS